MAEAIKIAAEMRERAGKGAARAARPCGPPARGDLWRQAAARLDYRGRTGIQRLWRDAAFYTHLYEVEAEGETYKVLARDVQTDPVMDWPIHIDFLRVSDRTKDLGGRAGALRQRGGVPGHPGGRRPQRWCATTWN